jgi:hypothetical protein
VNLISPRAGRSLADCREWTARKSHGDRAHFSVEHATGSRGPCGRRGGIADSSRSFFLISRRAKRGASGGARVKATLSG